MVPRPPGLTSLTQRWFLFLSSHIASTGFSWFWHLVSRRDFSWLDKHETHGWTKKRSMFSQVWNPMKNNMNIVVTFWKHIKKHVCELLIIKKTSWTRGIKRTIWSAFLLVSDVGNWSGWIKATWTAKVSFCGWILMVYKTMGVHKGTSFQQVIGENSWKPRRSNVFWWMIAAKGKKTTTPQKHPKKENNMGKHGKITRGNHMGSWFLAMLI